MKNLSSFRKILGGLGRCSRSASLLLAMACLCACGGAPRLQVSVLDASTEKAVPLRDADVSVQASEAVAPTSEQKKSTDSAGEARFEKLTSGLYQVRIAKSGYSTTQVEVDFPSKRKLELSIRQVFSVHGSILFPDGRPVEDAVVYFIAPGGERLSAVMSGSEYRIADLTPALYEVRAGTRDRLYSVVLKDFQVQTELTRDITLDDMPPQFEMLEDEPLAVPSSSGRGRIPKQ